MREDGRWWPASLASHGVILYPEPCSNGCLDICGVGAAGLGEGFWNG
jgi:hypothetical protein